MPAAPADSALYRDIFGDAETAALFTDSTEIRSLLLVEGALARVQGQLGLIPTEAAALIDRAAHDVQIDPGLLAPETARNGVPVPALLSAFRKAADAPDHLAWLHWGATSQDIIDTALALRLRQVIDLWDQRLSSLLLALASVAESHADLPMAARSYGQAATPTSFGALVASWGRPLLRHRGRLAAVRPDVLKVSLSGAAGTLSAMGPQGPAVRAALAAMLDLADPGSSWHSERDGIAAFAAVMAGMTASLGKLGEDLILLSQTGLSEVLIAGAGGSSTMPQKQNPVTASVLVALARQVAGLCATLTAAGLHRQMRDGAAWFTEWLTLPQMVISTGRALACAGDLVPRLTPDPVAMARVLDAGSGTIHAEAATFALAALLPRPAAEDRVKRLCAEAVASGTDLRDLLARDFPSLPSLTLSLGTAPDDARAFARAVRRDAQSG